MGANTHVTIPSTVKMMQPTTFREFETTTKEFFNAYLPLYNGTTNVHQVEIVNIAVVDQLLRDAGRLTIHMIVQVTVSPGDPGEDFVLLDLIQSTWAVHRQAYLDALAAASNFFRDASQSMSASDRQGQNGNSERKDPPITVIVPSVCLATLALAALVTWKVRSVASNAVEEPDDSLGAISWSTSSPSSVQEAKSHHTGFTGFEDLSTLGSAGAC
jgi:hypothetical protein